MGEASLEMLVGQKVILAYVFRANTTKICLLMLWKRPVLCWPFLLHDLCNDWMLTCYLEWLLCRECTLHHPARSFQWNILSSVVCFLASSEKIYICLGLGLAFMFWTTCKTDPGRSVAPQRHLSIAIRFVRSNHFPSSHVSSRRHQAMEKENAIFFCETRTFFHR